MEPQKSVGIGGSFVRPVCHRLPAQRKPAGHKGAQRIGVARGSPAIRSDLNSSRLFGAEAPLSARSVPIFALALGVRSLNDRNLLFPGPRSEREAGHKPHRVRECYRDGRGP